MLPVVNLRHPDQQIRVYDAETCLSGNPDSQWFKLVSIGLNNDRCFDRSKLPVNRQLSFEVSHHVNSFSFSVDGKPGISHKDWYVMGMITYALL